MHDAVFALVEERAFAAAPRELRLVSEWRHRAGQQRRLGRDQQLRDENQRLNDEFCRRKANLRTALAHANICVFEQDHELRYTFIYNESGAGAPPDALPPAKLRAMETLNPDKRRALAGERTRSELPVIIDGEPRDLVVIHEPVRGADGVISGIVGTTIDVTEEKRVQRELAQTITFREKIMAVLGHDLRNPLGAVLGIVGLARLDPNIPQQGLNHLAQIESAARRMLELIGTLIDFTRTRFAGTLPLSPAAVDLGELTSHVVDELAVAHAEATIELSARGDLGGRWDGGRLAQVVSNLVANAITHGDLRAPVRLGLDGDGDDVVLTVHNLGPAIAPELLPLVFEPFRHGAQEDATQPLGLGLGLFIARQIVLAHHGSIAVQSTALEGTTFVVRLPRDLTA